MPEPLAPEPLAPEVFATLLAQAGLRPEADEADEAEDWRQAHARLRAMLELCRPNELAAEPAFAFAVEELP
jgi:hypothetical protein